MPIQCPDGKGVKDILVVDGLSNQMSIKEVWLSDADKNLTKRWSKLKQLQYCIVDSDVVIELPEYMPGRFLFEWKVQLTSAPTAAGYCLYGTDYFYAVMLNAPFESDPYRYDIRSDSVTVSGPVNLIEPTVCRDHFGPLDALWGHYPSKLFTFQSASGSGFRGQFFYLTIWMVDSTDAKQWKVVDLHPVSVGGRVGLRDDITGNIIYPSRGTLQPGPDL